MGVPHSLRSSGRSISIPCPAFLNPAQRPSREQWMWPVPLFIGVWLAPESPWWLLRKGRKEDAKTNLLRLTSKTHDTEFDVDETLAMMEHTTKLEEKVSLRLRFPHRCIRGRLCLFRFRSPPEPLTWTASVAPTAVEPKSVLGLSSHPWLSTDTFFPKRSSACAG